MFNSSDYIKNAENLSTDELVIEAKNEIKRLNLNFSESDIKRLGEDLKSWVIHQACKPTKEQSEKASSIAKKIGYEMDWNEEDDRESIEWFLSKNKELNTKLLIKEK